MKLWKCHQTTSNSNNHKYKVNKKQHNLIKSATTKEKNNSINNNFSFDELQFASKKCKGSSAGFDDIHYEFVEKMSNKNKKVINKLYNNIWENHEFPTSWKVALVIPILKPGKDPKNAINYRPISLISCLCKVMERMVNRRIMYFLEKNEIISNRQFAFQKHKSTMDNIIVLESYISEAFLEGKDVCAILFDLEKAYDKTKRDLIIDTAAAIGLHGNTLKYIINFLNNRKFRVCSDNSISG